MMSENSLNLNSADRLLSSAAALGNRAALRRALQAGADPKANDSNALARAAREGHLDCVDLLIPLSDPAALDSRALIEASGKGHLPCVERLLPFCQTPKSLSSALSSAAYFGHLSCVELLLPLCDPKADNSSALLGAAQNGLDSVVELLLPLSDPLALDHNNLNAAQAAMRGGHKRLAKFINGYISANAQATLLDQAISPATGASRLSRSL